MADDGVVIIPFDRHERVYPWGPHFVRDFAVRHTGAQLGLVDLGSDEQIHACLDWTPLPRTAEVLRAVRSRLPEGISKDDFLPGPFYLQALEGSDNYAAGLLLLSNREFLARLCSLAGKPGLAALVDAEVQGFASTFRKKLHDRLRERLTSERPIFGVSHFGRSLTSSLSCVYTLRQLYPQATIVLGGAHLTPDLSRALTASDVGVDAVVVGFGERPFSELVQLHRTQGSVVGAQIPYVVTRDSAEMPGGTAAHEYRFEPKNGPFADDDYESAQVDGLGHLHILPIRGCRWGACTFCADAFSLKRYRAPVIGAPDAKLARDIARAVRLWATAGKTYGRLYIDSAEVYGDEAIAVLRLVDEELKALDFRFSDGVSVFFYMPARKVELEISRRFRAFSASTWQSFSLTPTIAIESLNEASLKSIRKGIDPLQAIASLKAGLDMGWSYIQAQYFIFYPGEEREAVAREIALLRRSLHILSSKVIWLHLLHLPIVGKEGGLYNAPDEHGLRCRAVEDPLLSLRFQREISAGGSAFAAQYRLDETNPRNDYSASWFALLVAWYWRVGRLEAARDEGKLSRWGLQLQLGGRLLKKGLRLLADAARGDRGLVERWLIAWWCARNGHRRQKRKPESALRHPRLEIRAGRLIKDYPFPFAERLDVALSESELKLLRAAYFPRRVAELEGLLDDGELAILLARHERLGTLVRQGDRLVCMVNDPEYLSEPNAVELRAPDAQSPAPLLSIRL